MLTFVTGFIELRFLDVLDIALVAVLLYMLYALLKGTVAINIFAGIAAIYFIWRLVVALQMEMLSQILGAFIGVGFIALIIVFQPELRQFLLVFGTPKVLEILPERLKFMFRNFQPEQANLDTDKIVKACHSMSDDKTGALIVVTHQHELNDIIETGEVMNARVSDQLIENIFFKNSPLHDGAMVISDNIIQAAGCILPVSKNRSIDVSLGLRHRAAIGITEATDCISLIVSEETGHISYCKNGVVVQNVQAHQLKNFLDKEFNPV
ncbi:MULTISPECIES: diadenylate cyclase CdaA [unclassified Lentimicrobium]|uniref:diadenylate cyclase CdaA n=1 Tax=unclassified Lentimicrobium TaxID=2677434 RepID=UPI00155340F7|nr:MULTISPECIES: diadenylate cyclase CdaA [unclassified Lentimicrobium]NPD44419.1 TIGR00159 family protein [Lentimicrobium sp. S6]NPD84315.1 TIGR00159 family protein [Lentimicrobium sp. L6]